LFRHLFEEFMLTTDYIVIALLALIAFVAWRILQTMLALKTSIDALRQTVADESAKQTSTLDSSLKTIDKSLHETIDVL
jgi:hypothetical protein